MLLKLPIFGLPTCDERRILQCENSLVLVHKFRPARSDTILPASEVRKPQDVGLLSWVVFGKVVQANNVVLTICGEQLARVCEGKRTKRFRVFQSRRDESLLLEVPYLHGISTHGQLFSVRCKRDGGDRGGTIDMVQQLPVAQRQDSHGSVAKTGGEFVLVRAERHAFRKTCETRGVIFTQIPKSASSLVRQGCQKLAGDGVKGQILELFTVVPEDIQRRGGLLLEGERAHAAISLQFEVVRDECRVGEPQCPLRCVSAIASCEPEGRLHVKQCASGRGRRMFGVFFFPSCLGGLINGVRTGEIGLGFSTVARMACQVLIALARHNTATNATRPAMAARCFRANLRILYSADGGRASIGSSSRCRSMSRAKPLAVSYRRLRSLSRAFITIQSKSPRMRVLSFLGSVRRHDAREGNASPLPLSRVLGFSASFSRISLNISSRPAARSCRLERGVLPVSNSYSKTP